MENLDDPTQKSDSQAELAKFCYGTAYFALPKLLFSQTERTIGYFINNEYPEGPYLYMMATRLLKVEPVREHALSFQAHSGELSPGRNYHILEYPTPPPFDLDQKDKVLAPFFSAIIHNTTSGEVAYYVLGQNPVSGTTFRTVTPDGANANMGPGPQPELDAFIEVLKQRA